MFEDLKEKYIWKNVVNCKDILSEHKIELVKEVDNEDVWIWLSKHKDFVDYLKA